MDLSQLQKQIKEDPAAYKEEFVLQYRHFMAQLQIFKLKPQHDNKEFIRLIKFLSNVERISVLFSLFVNYKNFEIFLSVDCCMLSKRNARIS
jgi:hypothetical protein